MRCIFMELSLSVKKYWCVTVHTDLPLSFLSEMRITAVKSWV